jgi:hypothetical protein
LERIHRAWTALLDRNTPCRVCGVEFYPERRSAKYCSHACRERAYRARREALLQHRLWPHWLGCAAAGMRLLIREGKPVSPEAVSHVFGSALPVRVARAALAELRALGDYDQIMREESAAR